MYIKLKTEYGELLCITDKNWNTRSVTFKDNQMIYQQFIVCDAVKYEFDELYKKIKILVTDLSNNGIEFNVKELRDQITFSDKMYTTLNRCTAIGVSDKDNSFIDYSRINIQVDKDFVNDIQEYISCLETKEFGNISDGYHTFDELYHHRAVLFSVICNTYKQLAWKSKKHDDGSMFDGMFIVGIETPNGPATYHYYIDKYWYLFNVKELEYAPKWDGHSPEDAIERIKSLV